MVTNWSLMTLAIGCNKYKNRLLGAMSENIYMPTHRKNARIFKCKILKTCRKDGEPRYRVNLPKALMESDDAKKTHFYAMIEVDTHRNEIIFSLEEKQRQTGDIRSD